MSDLIRLRKCDSGKGVIFDGTSDGSVVLEIKRIRRTVLLMPGDAADGDKTICFENEEIIARLPAQYEDIAELVRVVAGRQALRKLQEQTP